jgi:tRNA (cmo5U34)-methyltransferase
MGKVDDFYNSISESYTNSIQRCVPQYAEMLQSLFYYLDEDFNPNRILELGCGTGNLTQLISLKYPSAQIDAVDISSECINVCQERVSSSYLNFIKADFADINLQKNKYDLVLSSISIHHLKDKDKEALFKKIYATLNTNGILSFCDQFKGETDYIYQRHIEQWKVYAKAQGASDDEWEMWMKHQNEHDYHSTLQEHIAWLKNAGFKTIDCTRKHVLWTTIYAEK